MKGLSWRQPWSFYYVLWTLRWMETLRMLCSRLCGNDQFMEFSPTTRTYHLIWNFWLKNYPPFGNICPKKTSRRQARKPIQEDTEIFLHLLHLNGLKKENTSQMYNSLKKLNSRIGHQSQILVCVHQSPLHAYSQRLLFTLLKTPYKTIVLLL